ncbi:DUF72 domain-containing protein [Candidatus Neomarinimicrobiota bacterium]
MVYKDHYPSQKAFQRRCLAEYARHFPAVGVDATFYRFPGEKLIDELNALTPDNFRFGLKVTEEITVWKYTTHPRYGTRKGEDNPNFLDGPLFQSHFLDVVSGLGPKLGPIIFQFGTLPRPIIDDGTFLDRLKDFLQDLPKGFQYAFEIRNRQLFDQDYFDVLRQYGVAHVHSSWSWMPTLPEQIARDTSFTAPYFVMRLLTPPQVAYQDAVESFFPYQRIMKPLPGIRQAIISHLNRALKSNFPGYVFVNNRLEGAAPLTIEQVLDEVLGPSYNAPE